ncbi:MAG: hypothetical protein U9O54_06680 [Chloroflexota bacterium]|nr:hypothetical protein [Chloroflexota bacterium]
MLKRKELRFYPSKHPHHKAILDWLASQRGSDNENLIHLMTQGLKVESGEISRAPSAPAPPVTQSANADLLPEIRKIVNAAIKSALRNADISISQEDQASVDDEAMKKTQDFIRGMADNFG